MTTRKPPPTPAKKAPAKRATPRKRPAMPGAGRPKKADELARIAAAMRGDLPPTRTMRKKQRAVVAAVNSLGAEAAASRIQLGNTYGAMDNGDLDPKATPLDVMIEAMRQAYKLGGAIMAAPFAEKAAPYVHGKINNIDLKQTMQAQSAQGGEPVQDMGLHRFLVEYVDTIDVPAKEVPDGTSST